MQEDKERDERAHTVAGIKRTAGVKELRGRQVTQPDGLRFEMDRRRHSVIDEWLKYMDQIAEEEGWDR